jgi:hypothetical protein
MEDVQLRNKDWVELKPIAGISDVDAIASKCFVLKGKVKTPQFRTSKVELYLEIQHEKHAAILSHIEDIEDAGSEHSVCSCILNFSRTQCGFLI